MQHGVLPGNGWPLENSKDESLARQVVELQRQLSEVLRRVEALEGEKEERSPAEPASVLLPFAKPPVGKTVTPPVEEDIQPAAFGPGKEPIETVEPEVSMPAPPAEETVVAPGPPPPPRSYQPAPTPQRESWEVRVATYWFPRIGGAFLLLAFAMWASMHVVGPWGKVGLGYIVAAALTIIGIRKRASLPGWAHPVTAAGLALSFLVTLTMGTVRPMLVIPSLSGHLAALAGNLALIFVIAHLLRSEVVAGVALVLAYFSLGVTETEPIALAAVTLLSLAAVSFLWLNRWISATAISVTATYASQFYVWLFLQTDSDSTVQELFWSRSLYLSCAFAVFVVGTIIARESPASDFAESDRRSERDGLIHYLAYVNPAAYLSMMIWLLRATVVYWNQSWLLFFSYAAVMATLATAFHAYPRIKQTYSLLASVAVAFGLVALASPGWLPVLLGVQAVGMLYASQQSNSWWGRVVSLGLLLVAGAYVVSVGEIDILTPGRVIPRNMPVWTITVTSLLFVAYTRVMLLRPLQWSTTAPVLLLPAIGGLVLAIGAVTNLQANEYMLLAMVLAGPTVVALAAWMRRAPLVTYTLVAQTALFVLMFLAQDTNWWEASTFSHYGLSILLGLRAAVYAERVLVKTDAVRYTLQGLLVVAHASMLKLILPSVAEPFEMIIVAVVALAVVIAGLAVSSRALFLSSGWFALGAITVFNSGLGTVQILLAVAIFVLAGLLAGAPRLNRRVSGETEDVSPVPELLLVLLPLVYFTVWTFNKPHPWTFLMLAGIFSLVLIPAIAFGRLQLFWAVIGTGSLVLGLTILAKLAGLKTGEHEQAAWSLGGTALVLVLVERALANRSRLQWFRDEPLDVQAYTVEKLQALLILLGLGILLTAIGLHPDTHRLYFTAALVCAGAAWIGFGFLFSARLYRQSGFAVICFGILKGFLYDALSLPRDYRMLSWATLGVLVIAVGFLYSRFRNRMDEVWVENDDAS